MKRLALVIDNKDPEKRGRVLVRIFPELENISEDHLPWAGPEINYSSGLFLEEGVYCHKVPEIDSYVYCDISDDWTDFHWLEEVPYFRTKYSYDKNTEELDEKFDDLEHEYPQPHYSKTKDGSIQFKNTETGEQGFYNPLGHTLHLKEDGTVKLESVGVLLEIDEQGSVTLESENFGLFLDNENKKIIITKIEEMEFAGASDFAVLFEPLKEILEKLLDHNHVAPTGPTTPAQESSGTPLSSLKGKLQDLKSIIKTD